MITTQSRKLSFLPYLLISTVVLLGHGWLLFNNAVFWDDWLVKGFLDDGNWHLLRNMTSEMGLPILAYFFGALKLLGLSEYYKAVAFILILLSAFLIYRIGLQTGLATNSEALLIALLSSVYPAFQTTVLMATLQYLFFYFLFFLAVLLLLIAETDCKSKMQQSMLRLVALVLFFLSFNLNSLLVFYFPFMALVFFCVKERRNLSWQELASFALIRRIQFIFLPFVYWGIKKYFFPTHGLYAKYNVLDPNLISVSIRLKQSLVVSAHKQTLYALGELLTHPLLWILTMAAVCAFYVKCIAARRNNTDTFLFLSPQKNRPKHFFIFGFVLLLSGIFPYAAAGIVPSTQGWNTRHSLLVSLPMAILLIAALKYLYVLNPNSFNQKPGKIDRNLVFTMIASSLILAFVLSCVSFYLNWQARAIKDEAIKEYLSTQDSLRPYSIYWVKDDFPVGGDTYYNFYEWSSMFKKIWGGQSRIAMQIEYMGRPIKHDLPDNVVFSNRYNLAEFNPNGRQICLYIKPGMPDMSAEELALRYFWLRAQALVTGDSSTSGLKEFIGRSTRIDAKILSGSESTLASSAACTLK